MGGNSNFNNFNLVDYHTVESYESPDLRHQLLDDKAKTAARDDYDVSLDSRQDRKFSYKGAPANAREEFGLLGKIETRQRRLPDESLNLYLNTIEEEEQEQEQEQKRKSASKKVAKTIKVHNKGKQRYGFALQDLSQNQPENNDASKQGVTLLRDTKSNTVRIASLDEERKRSWRKQMRRTQVHKLGEDKNNM